MTGTYVKEFVHSDFGRTVPNLGTLLAHRQLDILALDVLVSIIFYVYVTFNHCREFYEQIVSKKDVI